MDARTVNETRTRRIFKLSQDSAFCLSVEEGRRMGIRVDMKGQYAFIQLVKLHPNANSAEGEELARLINVEIARALDLDKSIWTTRIADVEKFLKPLGKIKRIDQIPHAHYWYEFSPAASQVMEVPA